MDNSFKVYEVTSIERDLIVGAFEQLNDQLRRIACDMPEEEANQLHYRRGLLEASLKKARLLPCSR